MNHPFTIFVNELFEHERLLYRNWLRGAGFFERWNKDLAERS